MTDVEQYHECKVAVHCKRGALAPNATLLHVDHRNAPIRLCLGCFFGYKIKYQSKGWTYHETHR